MWKCHCGLLHQNPEIHWKHLREFPECLEKTLNPHLKGWQGTELDGPPKLIDKS